ncbi:MAG: TolC family protein [Candidatus Sericytochromatia bacterium]|nr:TolC family protein [Candidatus Sericytochromatia bacterium]
MTRRRHPARFAAFRRLSALGLVGLLATATPAWAAATVPPVVALTSEPALAALIWAQNPDVRQAAFAERQSLADLRRSELFPNPLVDVGQLSLPTGLGFMPEGTNLFHAPAQYVGVTQPVDFTKRPLRQARAQYGVRLAHWQTLDMHKQRTADLLAVVGRLAISQLRLQLWHEQTVVVQELVRLSALTAKEGFTAPLDHEKLLLEQGRLQTLADLARITREQARNDWAMLTLTQAPELQSGEAERIMDRLAHLPVQWPDPTVQLDHLPQRRMLELQRSQAGVDLAIAKQLWVPDVGVRVAYTFDTLPGNIPHSLAWSVSGPIPVFQAGEAETIDAQARSEAYTVALQAQASTTAFNEANIRQRATLLSQGLVTLRSERLPAARATLARLQTALTARGIPLTDFIQVRRTYLDLEGVRVDLLEQLHTALVDYRRLLAWQLPDPLLSPAAKEAP